MISQVRSGAVVGVSGQYEVTSPSCAQPRAGMTNQKSICGRPNRSRRRFATHRRSHR